MNTKIHTEQSKLNLSILRHFDFDFANSDRNLCKDIKI